MKHVCIALIISSAALSLLHGTGVTSPQQQRAKESSTIKSDTKVVQPAHQAPVMYYSSPCGAAGTSEFLRVSLDKGIPRSKSKDRFPRSDSRDFFPGCR